MLTAISSASSLSPLPSSCAAFANMCCPEALSASATSAISPVLTEPLCSHSLAFSLPANLSPIPASPTPCQPHGAAHAAEPTCTSDPTLPRYNWPSDANCPTPPDPATIQSLSNVCQHVFALLRPNRKTTALSRITGCMQVAKLPLSRTSTSHRTPARLPLPDSSRRSPKPSLVLSSIAAPTTASAFLLVSLSKMPRSNLVLPQRPAPRHFRSRLTTMRPSDQKCVCRRKCWRRRSKREAKAMADAPLEATAHSMRNARTGSMDAARRAGMMPAMAAVTISTPMAILMTGMLTPVIS